MKPLNVYGFVCKGSQFRYLWLHRFLRRYDRYRNRAVPLIMSTLKRRSIRAVNENWDPFITTETAMAMMERMFQAMEPNDKWMKDEFAQDPLSTSLRFPFYSENRDKVRDRHYENSERLYKNIGFRVGTRPSLIPNAGEGAFVTAGSVPSHTVVAMYPGLVYELGDPIMIPSIRNEYIFRCIDGIVIDGKSKGLSKYLYKSCCEQDNLTLQVIGDVTWMTPHPCNPLAIGQYVNCATKKYPANVIYQEIDFPCLTPNYLRKYIPNSFYRKKYHPFIYMTRPLRSVILVTTRRIEAGEELFSEYITTVAKPEIPD